MTNEEILKQSFNKARKNGWKESFWYEWSDYAWEDYANNSEHLMFIFKKDFAKAFFGENKLPMGMGNDGKMIYYDDYEWEQNLQQMVLEDEPLKYLEKYL